MKEDRRQGTYTVAFVASNPGLPEEGGEDLGTRLNMKREKLLEYKHGEV